MRPADYGIGESCQIGKKIFQEWLSAKLKLKTF